MLDISKLNKTDLKQLLKKLKLLSSLKKALWNRWNLEYKRLNNWINLYKVEYFEISPDSLSFVKEKSQESFKKLFWLDLKLEEIIFVKNQNLKWWFRIFYNDNMFDLSYKRFENLLK